MPVVEWLRTPSENLRSAIANAADVAIRLRELAPYLGTGEPTPPQLTDAARKDRQLELLRSISMKIAETQKLNLNAISMDDISRDAPGLSTCIATAVDAMWTSMSKMPRKPAGSDFVDAIHTIYAPYVDIFRTDGFMAPLVVANTKKYKTEVVGKLADLVSAIERKLVVF
jgi:hypothetical protein